MKNPLKEKSQILAIKIIAISKNLKSKNEYELASQLIRSWTSIWAMIREWEYAESKADLKSKLSVALKEANETQYWLELIDEAKILIIEKEINNLLSEIIKMLISSIKTLKK